MSLHRRLAVGSSVAAVAVVLVGCGPSAPAPGGAAGGAGGAASATVATPTPTPTAVFTVTAATFAEQMKAAAGKASSCTFTLVFTAQGQTVNGSGVMRVAADATSEVAMTMTASGTGTLDLRVVGGVWYINGGAQTGGKFVKADPKDPNGPFAGMEGLFDSVNPNQGMASVQDAVVAVTPVGGTEAVGGVPTQAYDVVLDTAKLTAQVRAQQLDDGAALPAQVTYRYWFGADGLVRKMVTDVQDQQQEMTFTGWGQPVDITAPPADQVVTLG